MREKNTDSERLVVSKPPWCVVYILCLSAPSPPPSLCMLGNLGDPVLCFLRSPVILHSSGLNIADLLLFLNIFHLPKYTGPAFLTLSSDLCVWSGNADRGEASLSCRPEAEIAMSSGCVSGSRVAAAGIHRSAHAPSPRPRTAPHRPALHPGARTHY